MGKISDELHKQCQTEPAKRFATVVTLADGVDPGAVDLPDATEIFTGVYALKADGETLAQLAERDEVAEIVEDFEVEATGVEL